jgi:hypothetical protein
MKNIEKSKRGVAVPFILGVFLAIHRIALFSLHARPQGVKQCPQKNRQFG